MSSLRGLYGHKGDTAGQDNLGYGILTARDDQAVWH